MAVRVDDRRSGTGPPYPLNSDAKPLAGGTYNACVSRSSLDVIIAYHMAFLIQNDRGVACIRVKLGGI